MTHADFDIRTWNDNPWATIADRWMLITAGTQDSWNTMTASWGGFGHLWNRDVAYIFVRPTRYTMEFLERSPGFSLSFFDAEHRQALGICGSVSGRNADKARLAGLTPAIFGEGSPGPAASILGAAAPCLSFREAEVVLSCRKLHAQNLDPECFIDPSIADHYKKNDWHRMYVGAIVRAWKKS